MSIGGESRSDPRGPRATMDVGRRRGESRRAGRRRVYRGRRPHHWSGLESPGWTIEDTGLPKEAHKQDDEQGCSRSSRTSCAPLHKALHGQKCRGGQDDEHGCSNVGGDRMSKADGPGGDEFIEAAGRTTGPAWRVQEGRATRTPGFRRKPINRTTNTDVLVSPEARMPGGDEFVQAEGRTSGPT